MARIAAICDMLQRQLQQRNQHSEEPEPTTANQETIENVVELSEENFQNILSQPYKRKKRQIQCKNCDRVFGGKREMRDHARTHSGETPFKCGDCGKQFNQQTNLRIHQRIHANDRRYACQQCEKTFVQKAALAAHSHTHTGEKPYVCSECGTCFSQRCSLSRHTLNIHNKPRPYKCDRCNRAFVQAERLRQHKRQVHSDAETANATIAIEIPIELLF